MAQDGSAELDVLVADLTAAEAKELVRRHVNISDACEGCSFVMFSFLSLKPPLSIKIESRMNYVACAFVLAVEN